jgi:hypothetical protein
MILKMSSGLMQRPYECNSLIYSRRQRVAYVLGGVIEDHSLRTGGRTARSHLLSACGACVLVAKEDSVETGHAPEA